MQCNEISFLVNNEIAITRNNLLAVIPEWGPNYKITFDLLIESFANGGNFWGNVFHFTATGDNCCEMGDRVPALWTNEGKFLYLCFNKGDDGNFCQQSPEIETNKWFSLEYEQKFEAYQVKSFKI